MHTTALWSPTGTCVLTGRNHHSNGMACITDGSSGFPGGNGVIAFTGTIHDVTVDVSGELIVDQEAENRTIMARQ